jgi:hypothetical protein
MRPECGTVLVSIQRTHQRPPFPAPRSTDVMSAELTSSPWRLHKTDVC